MASSQDDRKLVFKLSFYKNEQQWKISKIGQPETKDSESSSGPLEENPPSSHGTSQAVDNHKGQGATTETLPSSPWTDNLCTNDSPISELNLDHAADYPTCSDSDAVHTSAESFSLQSILEVLPETFQCNSEVNCSNPVETQNETESYKANVLLNLTKEKEVIPSSPDQNILFDDYTWQTLVHQCQDEGIPKHLQLEGSAPVAGGSSASVHIGDVMLAANIFSNEERLLCEQQSCSVQDKAGVDSRGEDWQCKHMDLALDSGWLSPPHQLTLQSDAFKLAREANSSTSSDSVGSYNMCNGNEAGHSSTTSLPYGHDAYRTMSQEELVQLSNNLLEKGIVYHSKAMHQLVQEYRQRMKDQPAPEIWVEAKSVDGLTYYYHLKNRNSTWTRPQDSPDCRVITQQELEDMVAAGIITQAQCPEGMGTGQLPQFGYLLLGHLTPFMSPSLLGPIESTINLFLGNDSDRMKDQAMPNPINPIDQAMNQNVMGDLEKLMGNFGSGGQLGSMSNPCPVSNQPSTINQRPMDVSVETGNPCATVHASTIENPGSVSNPEAAERRAPEVFPGPRSGLYTISSGLTYPTAWGDPTREDEASLRIPVLDETRPVLRPKSSQQAVTQPRQAHKAKRARKVPYAQAMTDPGQDFMMDKFTYNFGSPPSKRNRKRRNKK